MKIQKKCLIFISDRDILNHSYFDKRNLYLGVLYSYLRTQDNLFNEIQFSYLKCDQRKPIISIQPNIKTPYAVVRVLITVRIIIIIILSILTI